MPLPLTRSTFSEQVLGGAFAVGSLVCCVTAFVVLTIHRHAQPERLHPPADTPAELEARRSELVSHCSYEAGKAGWYGPAC